MARTALVVAVPEVDEVLGEQRQTSDPMAAVGVPAHVTVLFPFVTLIDADVEERVAAACQTASGFAGWFPRVGRFSADDGDVVWLEPQPDEGFREVITAVGDAFPECVLYEGKFADLIPHLTIGQRLTSADADALVAAASHRLPIHTRVIAVTLLVEDTAGRWTAAREFPLG